MSRLKKNKGGGMGEVYRAREGPIDYLVMEFLQGDSARLTEV